MPILQVYVDDGTMRRLQVYSVVHNRPLDGLVESAVSEAASRAVPCDNGEPIDAEYRAAWPAFSGA